MLQGDAVDSKTTGFQAAWLRENLQPHFAGKLLHMVREIQKHVLPKNGKPEHAFPILAGSHLSEASR